ncbi:MAG TPA: hypothetical protein VGE50_07000 [Gammaproteobacteria bacterium]
MSEKSDEKLGGYFLMAALAAPRAAVTVSQRTYTVLRPDLLTVKGVMRIIAASLTPAP